VVSDDAGISSSTKLKRKVRSIMRRRNGGFTLIELIVVIAILGILVAVAVPKYIDLTKKARKSADDGYLAGLRAATLMIYASNILEKTTNALTGGYWPSLIQVTNQMSESYTWQYYTGNAYDETTGVWSVSGSGF
jgi:prepilin-type N-terminal cleavage/methylation domain-containing protein